MSQYGKLFNALLFQIGWIACVFGGNRWGVLAVAVVLPLHYFCVARSGREWLLIATCTALGLAVDTGWQWLGLLQFEGALAALPPPWLAALWLLFSTTLNHSLVWLQNRLLLAAVCGAVFGPLSYVAGLGLGAATSAFAYWQVALAMAPAWALLLPLLMFISRSAAQPREGLQ